MLTFVIAVDSFIGTCSAAAIAKPRPLNSPAPSATISISLINAKADHVSRILTKLYPRATVRADAEANTIIILAPAADAGAIRGVVASLDVKNPQAPQSDILQFTTDSASALADKLRPIFPRARFIGVHPKTLLVTATAADLAQIHSLAAAIDVPPPSPPSAPDYPSTAYHLNAAEPSSVARALARALPKSRVSVSGAAIVVKGPPEDAAQVKALLEQLDRPLPTAQYVAVYRLANVDATSVASLLTRSYPSLMFVVTKELNAISVAAKSSEQTRIADAIAQLDAPPGNPTQNGSGAASGGNDYEVMALHAAVPAAGTGGGPSSTANDIAQTVTQALAASAPDLKISVQPNSTRLVISGSTHSRELAIKLISQLDVAEPLVELDTRVLEIDEGAQTQLGLKFPAAALSTTYTEITPTNASGANANFLQLQGLTRTPLSLQAQLDFLIAHNEAKILEDPRITTFSGRTATLRAGETVNILTTAGGGTGTVATTQIQSFQTGVTLDITPVVNADNYVTVTLHPSVNSIAGIGTSGVPNIQTRDTTTTIGLHDGETLVVGGLIEDTDTKTVQKIPLLGDIPLIGRLFQDVGTSHARNELVVTVTPHILKPGEVGAVSRLQLAPSPLPTVAPNASLPPSRPVTVSHLSEVPSPEATARPTNTPAPQSAAASAPPTAFAQTNTFTYGSAPQDNYEDQNQPPRIFFIRVQPTVVKTGVPVTIYAITTSNVVSAAFAPSGSTQPVRLMQLGPGKWQATFPFDASELPSTSGNVSETLTATNSAGTATTVIVPLSLQP